MFLSNDFANAWLIVSQLLRTFAAVLTNVEKFGCLQPHKKMLKLQKRNFPFSFRQI